MSQAHDKGQWAENLAYTYLCAQGLQLLDRNYHCRLGEIDLIMQHSDILVFVEVRYRKSQDYGGSLESIQPRKQQRIISTATHYLSAHPVMQQARCRFDVVLITGSQTTPQLRWIANAFQE